MNQRAISILKEGDRMDTIIEKNEVDTSIYYDIREALSYQHCSVFAILGPRGCGKTHSSKKYALDKIVIEKGKQFAYIRRTESDLERTKSKFFNDLSNKYPDRDFRVSGDKYLMDGEIVGYNYALSTSLSVKGDAVPQVAFIIVDEFLIDPNAPYQRYLKNEVYLFFHLIESIARPIKGKPLVPVVLLGNVYTSINPWFTELDIVMPTNKKMIRTNDRGVFVQVVNSEKFKQAKRETAFGRLVRGTKYADASIDNKFIRDDDTNICKPPNKLRYMFTLRVGGLNYGVSMYNNESLFYVSEKYDKNCNFKVTAILDDHTENTMLLKGKTKNVFYEDLKIAYNHGLIRYDGLLSKNAVYESLWR